MTGTTDIPTAGRRNPETIEGREYQRSHVPKAESRNQAWLPWKTGDGRNRGIALHRVAKDGTVEEISDPKETPREKPDVIKMRQARRFAKRGR